MNQIKKNIIEVFVHLLLSLLLSVWVYFVTTNLFYAAVLLTGGVLMDLDHIIDHFLFFRNKFSLADLFNNSHLRSGKVFLFLHSWELICLLFVSAYSLNLRGLFFFAMGLSLHLLIDNIQKQNKLFYLLIYRAYKGFEVEILLPEEKRFL